MALDTSQVTPRAWFDDVRCQTVYLFIATKRISQTGVSENSVPLNPMVLLIIIPIKWL